MTREEIPTSLLRFVARNAPEHSLRVKATREIMRRGESVSDDPRLQMMAEMAHGEQRPAVCLEGRDQVFRCVPPSQLRARQGSR